MGTWGTGTFDNDEAMDFVSDAIGKEGDRAIELALAPPDDDGITDECTVLAAAEIVAAARGHAAAGVPADVLAWVERTRPRFADELSHRCRVLVRTIANESEPRTLWEEAGEEDLDAWLDALQDLDERLGRPAT